MSTENVKAFNDYRYVVWTQAGFNQACKALHKAMDDTEIDCPIEGFPKAYPSLVVFSGGYQGYHYWHAHCVPLTKAIENLRAQLSFLEATDSEHAPSCKSN